MEGTYLQYINNACGVNDERTKIRNEVSFNNRDVWIVDMEDEGDHASTDDTNNEKKVNQPLRPDKPFCVHVSGETEDVSLQITGN